LASLIEINNPEFVGANRECLTDRNGQVLNWMMLTGNSGQGCAAGPVRIHYKDIGRG